MNKKTAAILAVMSVVCSTGFAANPFTDVPKDSWAYNSVMELAQVLFKALIRRILRANAILPVTKRQK